MMKQIVICLILSTILFSACSKRDERPSVIYINGTVTDKTTSSPLDSVSIVLNEDRGGVISSVLIPLKTYSTSVDGQFSFEYSQNKELYSYKVVFSKKSYLEEKVHLDKDKETQHLNIQLTK